TGIACHVERCPFFTSALERIGRTVIDRKPCPSRALERRPKLAQHLLDSMGAEDGDFCHRRPFIKANENLYARLRAALAESIQGRASISPAPILASPPRFRKRGDPHGPRLQHFPP